MTGIERDEGGVIGYKPKLEYVKEITSTEEVESPTVTSYDGTKFSKTINSIAENLPGSTLSTLDFVTDNMQMLIEQLTKHFDDNDWNEYNNISSLISAIENNNKEYIDTFINYHSNNIAGSIVPELIGTINSTRKRLVLLSDTLKKLYYNDVKLTTEQTQEIDKGYLNQIQKYELSDEINKINYLAISNDSILNRSVSLYAYEVNEKVIDLTEIVMKNDPAVANKEQADLVKKLYEEVNREIQNRKTGYNEEQNLDIMTKSLYNYYDKRKGINEIYSILDTSQGSAFITKKTKDYRDKLNEAITDINKSLAGNAYYISELTDLEQEKAHLMNIYATFNYNSEK